MRSFYIPRFIRYLLRTRHSCIKVTCKNWSISRHLLRYIAQSKIVLQFQRQKYHSCGLSASDIVRKIEFLNSLHAYRVIYTRVSLHFFTQKFISRIFSGTKLFLTFFVRYKISIFEHTLSMWLKLFHS